MPLGHLRGAAIFVLASVAFLSGASWASVGRTPGTFFVDSQGAANYTIPIWAPPGPKGIQPSIALTYNSGQGSGFVGLGWSIGGLSSITRCDRTVVQDGAAAPVALLASDGYCLDGQRLMLTGGTYGTTGSTYQTEVATYQNVTAYGSAGNGPAYFIVQAPNGTQYEYGNASTSATALLMATGTGTSTALTWLLDKVTDTAGNTMTITYLPGSTLTGGSATAVPSIISWTPVSHGSSTYQYKMQFNYGANVPASSTYAYVAGTPMVNTQLLKSIAITSGATTVKYYNLTYIASGITSREELQQIQECADSSLANCLPPTTVNYGNSIGGSSSTPTTILSSGVSYPFFSYDFNGDGIPDVLYYSGSTWYVAFGTTSGYTNPVNTTITATPVSGMTVGRLLNSNEDGILVKNGTTWWYYTYEGGSFSGINTYAPVDSNAASVSLVDVNGDGQADMVSFYPSSSTSNAHVTTRLNTTSAGVLSFSSTAVTAFTDPGNAEFQALETPAIVGGLRSWDFNGDGRQDLFFFGATVGCNQAGCNVASESYTLLGQSDGTFASVYAGAPGSTFFPQFINWNNDKCTDMVAGTTVYISSCNGAIATTIPLAGTLVATADMDGDGRTDAIINQSNTLAVQISSGTGVQTPVSLNIPVVANAAYESIDVGGTGLAELTCFSCTAGSLVYYPRNSPGTSPDLLSTITDGTGNYATPTYTPLTAGAASGVYTAGTGATGTESDWTGSMIVVQAVTSPDGIGGTYTRSYHYTDARTSQQRGFEGFASQQVTDSRPNSKAIESISYSQLFPLTGMVSEDSISQSDGTPISVTQYTNASTPIGGTAGVNQRFTVYRSNVSTQTYEVGGTENGSANTLTNAAYAPPDPYGNVPSVTTTLTDEDPNSPFPGHPQWSTTTTFAVTPNTTTWCVNLPTSVAVATTAPGEATITHTTSYPANDYQYCRPTVVTTDAGNSSYDVSSTLSYDYFGNVDQAVVTGMGFAQRTSTIYWGSTGQFPTRIQNPDAFSNGYQELIGYDPNTGLRISDVMQTTGGVNNAPPGTWAYDAFGRLQAIGHPDGTSETVSYSACAPSCYNGNHFETVNHTQSGVNGSEITDDSTYLDRMGRNLVVRRRLMDGTYNQIEQQYDNLGHIVNSSAPCSASSCLDYWTQSQYDALDRLTQTSRQTSQGNSVPAVVYYQYQGRTTKIIAPTGALVSGTSIRVNDAAGNLRQTVDPSGLGDNLVYDSDGNVLSVTDTANNAVTSQSYYYGGQGDFVHVQTDRALGTWTYTADALGNVDSYTDAKGQTFTLSYDGLSRPISRTDPMTGSEAQTVTQWTWGHTPASHDVGQLDVTSLTASDGTFSKTYTYDAYGRLQTQAILIPNDATYQYSLGYDPNSGLLAALQYPANSASAGPLVAYCYQYGTLQSVRSTSCTGTAYWQANAVNPRGQMTQTLLGNGIYTTRSFDAVTGTMTNAAAGPSAGSTSVLDQGYLYDAVPNMTQRQDLKLGLTESFYYDSVNRLISSTLAGGSYSGTNLSLNYNTVGTFYTKQVPTGTETPIAKSIVWTSYNYPRAITATLPTVTQSATFSYGPDRQRWRMALSSGSATETDEYIGDLMEKVISSTIGTHFRYYVRGADGLAAIFDVPSSGATTGKYVLSDPLSSISTVLNSDGSTDINESFTAYGNRRSASSWSGPPNSTDVATMDGLTRMGYTGQTVLAQMGLNHMNGRVQDAASGMFLSPDPTVQDWTNPGDYNRYAYVLNNPLSLIDPSGFDAGGCPDGNVPNSGNLQEAMLQNGTNAQSDSVPSLCLQEVTVQTTHLPPLNFNVTATLLDPALQFLTYLPNIQLVRTFGGGGGGGGGGGQTGGGPQTLDPCMAAAIGAAPAGDSMLQQNLSTAGQSVSLLDGGNDSLLGASGAAVGKMFGNGSIPGAMTSPTNAAYAEFGGQVQQTLGTLSPYLKTAGFGLAGGSVAAAAYNGYQRGGVSGAASASGYAAFDAAAEYGMASSGLLGVGAALLYDRAGGSQTLMRAAVVTGNIQACNAMRGFLPPAL